MKEECSPTFYFTASSSAEMKILDLQHLIKSIQKDILDGKCHFENGQKKIRQIERIIFSIISSLIV